MYLVYTNNDLYDDFDCIEKTKEKTKEQTRQTQRT